MSRAAWCLAWGNAALAAFLLASFASQLGAARWQADAAYAALAVVTAVAWPRLRRRRLTTLLMASAGAWSTLTGLFLVYVTPALGHGRWMRWWHGATSAVFLLAFLAHWARNQPRLAQLAGALARRRRLAGTVVGAWAALVLLVPLSWTTSLGAAFDDLVFRELTTASLVLAAAVLAVAAIVRSERDLAQRERNATRGGLDLSLLVTTWLVAITGFALQYASRVLRDADAYWHFAGWHVVLSAVLVGAALAHATFNRRPLRAHASGGGQKRV